MAYPDFSKPFIITTDASKKGLGAVLSQGDIGDDKPIAFASRTLNKAEGNYSTTEREIYAILYGINYFRPYVFGNKFMVVTDHKPLAQVFRVKDPGSRLTKYRLALAEYDCTIVYRPEKNISNADALSRLYVTNVYQHKDNQTKHKIEGFLEFEEYLAKSNKIITNLKVSETHNTIREDY